MVYITQDRFPNINHGTHYQICIVIHPRVPRLGYLTLDIASTRFYPQAHFPVYLLPQGPYFSGAVGAGRTEWRLSTAAARVSKGHRGRVRGHLPGTHAPRHSPPAGPAAPLYGPAGMTSRAGHGRRLTPLHGRE